MIRFADNKDLPQVKSLWMQAFSDSPAATDFYFAHRSSNENLLVLEEEGALQGMLSMLPITLRTPRGDYAARYFFAIATFEGFRGRGVSTRLMAEAERITRARGEAAALLVPASGPLFAFYAKRGYQRCFDYERLSLSPSALPQAPAYRLLPCGAKDMLRLRDHAHRESALYARWNEEALSYVEKAAATYEAPLLRFEAAGGEGYAYCEWEGDTLLVKDLALRGMDVPAAVSILHRELHAGRYQLRLPVGAGLASERVPFGLWKPFAEIPLQGGPPFLSLGKD